MRNCIFLFCIFSASLLASGQRVSDDSISYTPIPLPDELKSGAKKEAGPIVGSRKFVYYLSFNVGSLFGCSDCSEAAGVSSSFSAVNGVTIGKKIRVGIGAGFDSYLNWSAVPVLASASWDLWGNRNSNAFFLQLNYGYSKAWMVGGMQGYGFDRAEGGRMFLPQIGYRLKYHDINLSFMTGLKLQRVASYYKYPTWNWVNGEYRQGTNLSKIEENMSRLMISVAVGWK